MSGLIHRRSWSISELIEVYDRSRDFKDGLETVWQLSFENLQPDCAALLSAFTFCAPDSIPQSLFEFNDNTENLTDGMLWYLDFARLVVFFFYIRKANNKHPRFCATTEELLALALVKRDRYDRVFSIHRLIAAQFRRFLNPKDRQKAFFEASILMYNAFPKRPKEPGVVRANLYNVWDRCQLWLQHVLQLKRSFTQEQKWDPSFSASREACETWVQCQRLVKIAQIYQQTSSSTISSTFQSLFRDFY